jgi:hypothetical protein
MYLPSVTLRHSATNFIVECLFLTLVKVYLFSLFSPNIFYYVQTVSEPTCLVLAQLSKCLLYLLDLVHLIEFLWIIQI